MSSQRGFAGQLPVGRRIPPLSFEALARLASIVPPCGLRGLRGRRAGGRNGLADGDGRRPAARHLRGGLVKKFELVLVQDPEIRKVHAAAECKLTLR